MSSTVQSKNLSSDLIFISETSILQTEKAKYIVLKKFLPGKNIKDQIEVNRIVYTGRIGYVENGNKTTFFITKVWFKRIQEEGISSVVFEEENEKYIRYKGDFKIAEMEQKKESEFKKLQK